MAHAIDSSRRTPLVKIGGSLGIAASFIGMAVFMAGLMGISAVFMLSVLPLLLGGVGIILTVIGSVLQTHGGDDETAPIAAIFCCMFGLIFGAIEWYIWMAPVPTAAGAAAH